MPRDSYKELLDNTKKFYKSLKKMRCKSLNNVLITFGNSGFKHLLTKQRKSRPINEQFRKLSLLKHLPTVLNSNNPKVETRVVESKDYGTIEYTSLTNLIDEREIKVILRKLGKGNHHFWSIMDL